MSAIVVRFTDITEHVKANAEIMSLLHYSLVAGVEHLYFDPPPELSDLFVVHLSTINSKAIDQAIAALEVSNHVKHARRS